MYTFLCRLGRNRDNLKHVTQLNTHYYVLFAPLAFIVIGLAILGIILVKGYEQGSVMPHVTSGNIFVDTPVVEPVVAPVTVVEAPTLPESISAIPTPNKIAPVTKMTNHTQPNRTDNQANPNTGSVVSSAAQAVQNTADTAGRVAGIAIEAVDPPALPQLPINPPADTPNPQL